MVVEANNLAPSFSGSFSKATIELTEDEQIEGLAEPTFSFMSDMATDPEGDTIKILLYVTTELTCNCATLKDNEDGTFSLSIDKTKLTAQDAGLH